MRMPSAKQIRFGPFLRTKTFGRTGEQAFARGQEAGPDRVELRTAKVEVMEPRGGQNSRGQSVNHTK